MDVLDRVKMECTGVPLKLHRFIPVRDVRKLIWALLAAEDREMIRMAQNSRRPPPRSTSFANRCALKGYISLLAWARTPARGWPVPWDEWACQGAASTGQFEMLKWLRAQSPPAPWDTGTFEAAVAHGNLEIVQWLANQGCPWKVSSYATAAKYGHVHILEWARVSPNACILTAAKYGQIAVLEWAKATDHTFGQDSTTWACQYAAEGGQLEALQWLRAHGFAWSRTTCIEAARHDHFHVLEWAIANGCPCDY